MKKTIKIVVVFIFTIIIITSCEEKIDGIKPVIKIVTPKNSTSFYREDDIEIIVTANDPDGLINLISFKIDDIVVHETEVEPFTYSWSSREASVGSHKITVTATDNSGLNESVSVDIEIMVSDPVIETMPISLAGTTLVISGIQVKSGGIPFYKTKGLCWNKEGSPTVEDNVLKIKGINSNSPDGKVEGKISGLDLNTKYYIRAFADNGVSIVYGQQIIVTTASEYFSDTGYILDPRDSKQYEWVKIGNQTWLSENLAYGLVYPDSMGQIYGSYYHIEKVTPGLCPDGWHVPTIEDWSELVDFVGGEEVAGGILKEAGTAHWNSPNTGATNSANFSALPAGHIYTKFEVRHDYLHERATFWTAERSSVAIYSDSEIVWYGGNGLGWEKYSCRCIKD